MPQIVNKTVMIAETMKTVVTWLFLFISSHSYSIFLFSYTFSTVTYFVNPPQLLDLY